MNKPDNTRQSLFPPGRPGKITYNVNSTKAGEFIDDHEIMETLEYAEANKSNRQLIEQLIDKAKSCKGLTHREAAVLLECDQKDLTDRIFTLAEEIKQKFYIDY